MKKQLDIELSPELEKFREKIEASAKPYIAIYAKEKNDVALWDSKFGGVPYLPTDYDYPIGNNSQPLFLLAQINFSDFPNLEGFPNTGILQFYISGSDEDTDLWGANFDDSTKQDGFRIIYFPTITKIEANLVTDFSFLPKPENLPFSECCSLQFEKKNEPVGVTDYKFDELFGEKFFEQFDVKEDEVIDEYIDKFSSDGHKIGGYAFFTQQDPRPDLIADKEILLLQIDTDDEAGIMWGDSGICNFFISQTDLDNLDFSKVAYNWDCH